MDPSAKAAFFVSLSSIAQVLTILAIGALSTHNGLLTPDARSLLARFTLKLSYPCLVLSVADDYNFSDLVRYFPLLVASVLHVALGAFLGWAAGRLFGLRSPDRHFLLLMTAFNNNGGLPFILLAPLCANWQPALDEGHPADVLARAYAMVVIYGLPWTVLLFTLGKNVIVDCGLYSADGSGDLLPQALLHSSHNIPKRTSSHVQLLPASEEQATFDGSDDGEDDIEKEDALDCGDVELASSSSSSSRNRMFRSKWARLGTNSSSSDGSNSSGNSRRLPVSTTGKEWVMSPLGHNCEEEEEEDEEDVPLPGCLNGAVIGASDEESDNGDANMGRELSRGSKKYSNEAAAESFASDLESPLAAAPASSRTRGEVRAGTGAGERSGATSSRTARLKPSLQSPKSSPKSPNSSPNSSPNASPPPTPTTWQRVWAVATREITITASLTSVLLACSGPIKRPFYAPGALSFVGGAIAAVGAPSPVVSTLVLSSGLYNSFAALLRRRLDTSTVDLTSSTATHTAANSAANTTAAIAADSVDPENAAASSPDDIAHPGVHTFDARRAIAANKSLELPTLDSSALPRSNTQSTPTLTRRTTSFGSKVAAEGATTREDDDSVPSTPPPLPYAPPPPSLALLAVCLKLLGLVSPSDKLLHMILYLESAVPSSQSAVALIQLYAGTAHVNRASSLYLPMYLSAAPTLSVAVAMAIWIIG